MVGTFAGGDGGILLGQVESGTYTQTYSEECANCINETQDEKGRLWEGVLYADGTGNGWFKNEQILWQITYSAADFQAGLKTNTNPTSNNTTDSQGTPDSSSTVSLEEVLEGPALELIDSLPEVDQAAEEILGQDAAIITRDEQGVYYVVDNQGVRSSLPVELQDSLKMNNEFGLLQNIAYFTDNLTVQALIAKEGTDVLEKVNGTGKYQFYEVPHWLLSHQYMGVSTDCNEGSCSEVTMAMINDSSFFFSGIEQPVFSAEHSSVRGTINGGGDFIYEPKPVILASLIFPILGNRQVQANPGYLGVQVTDTASGLEISQVQRNSPAEIAGLQTGDLITEISGLSVKDKNQFLNQLVDLKGGDQISLGILRGGQNQAIELTLANLLPPKIITPAAEITPTDQSNIMVDIGLNGVTGIMVISGAIHVREPVTGTEVDVPSGTALIVAPGIPLSEPFSIPSAQVNKWWENPQPSTESVNENSLIGYKDFNPFAEANEASLYIIGAFVFGLLYIIVMIIVLVKK